jgi:molybdopterin converting factor small subunit
VRRDGRLIEARVKVRIPTPLRSYTDQRAEVDAEGSTLAELLVDLDRRHPGIRFRMVDEQGNLRKHMKIFLNGEAERDLALAITPTDDVVVMQALSGG